MKNKDIKSEIKAILLTALRDVDCYLFLFGSQVSGDVHDRSDYDVGILAKQPLNFSLLSRLKGYMEAIPALIDVIDFYNTPEDFRNIALRHVELWKTPKHPEKFKFQIEESLN